MAAESRERILFVSSSSSYFLHHHLNLAAAAAGLYDVHVALPLDSPDHRERFERRGIAAHPLVLSRSTLNALTLAGEIRRLAALMGKIRPDLVNPLSLKCVFVAAFAAARHPGCAFVGTLVGLGHLFSGASVGRRALAGLTLRALRRTLLRLRHRLIFSNPDDRDLFLGRGVCGAEAARVIPVPGVRTPEGGPPEEPEGGFRVVMPARLIREKGFREFAEAARLVRERDPAVDFQIAGGLDPGNPSALSEREVRAWAARGGLTWLGRVDDMPALLARCHVVCLPSWYREGFPRVLAEAMASGRSIVTTDAPGCREAGRQYGCALLAPPKNARKLADAILLLRNSPALRRRLADNGYRAARRFLHEPAITGEVLAVFASLLAASAGRIS